MAISTYDEQFLTDEQRRQLDAFTKAWERANAAGDRAGMDSAHAAAERVRAQAGYSGGADGMEYSGLGGASGGYGSGFAGGYGSASGGYGSGGYGGYGSGGTYKPAETPSYKARTEEVNKLYDAARDAELAGLRSAFEAGKSELEAKLEELPGVYGARRNEAASRAELSAKNFNEYAAASGLGSGAGGQARLAMTNELQRELSDIGAQETSAKRELDRGLSQLKLKYQSDIASAVAGGEYKRAAELLEEYRREEESAVSAAKAQADENYRAWQSGFSREQYDYERARDEAEALENERQRQLEFAEFLARYGDWSGLRAMGVDTSAYEAAQAAGAGNTGGAVSSGSSGKTQSSGKTASSGSSGNTTSSGGKSQDYAGLYAAAKASGNAKSFIANNYKSYGFTSSTGLYDDYKAWLASSTAAEERRDTQEAGRTVTDLSQLGDEAMRLLNGFARSYGNVESNRRAVMDALGRGAITGPEAEFLLKSLGYGG